jgi:uncharacterized protein (TIGR00730 family)
MAAELEKKRVTKFLNKKIQQMNQIIDDLDGLVREIGTDFFRVSIFGSARIKPDTKAYQEVYQLAYRLAQQGVDVVTGGGPGLMEAANFGAQKGSDQGHSRSIGLPIELPWESDANKHLDVKYHHRRFSSRLDEFMRISHAVVVTPGGLGTSLELFFAWQLMQVGHISPRPLLLWGKDFWAGLLGWLEQGPLQSNLLDKKDLKMLTVVDSVDEVIEHLRPVIEEFERKKGAEEGGLQLPADPGPLE